MRNANFVFFSFASVVNLILADFANLMFAHLMPFDMGEENRDKNKHAKRVQGPEFDSPESSNFVVTVHKIVV